MKRMCSHMSRHFTVVVFFCCAVSSASAQELHAKAFNIIDVTFPRNGEVWNVSIRFARNGEDLRPFACGLPRPWQLLTAVEQRSESTSILVPAVGSFGLGQAAYAFSEPGTYHLRWSVTFRDKNKPRTVPDQRDEDIPPVVIDETVELRPARQSDIQFIDRVADPEMLRTLFGDDYFQEQTSAVRARLLGNEGTDQRALAIIRRLLYITRDHRSIEAVDMAGPKGDRLGSAHALFKLARELPDSSYAPYAAYYAGCCYAAEALSEAIQTVRSRRVPGEPKDEIDEAIQRCTLLQSDPRSEQAIRAFRFASERADAYLKPRALYQEGALLAGAGDFEASLEVLSILEDSIEGSSETKDRAAKLKDNIAEFRERFGPAMPREAHE